jgi:hypothetical protein
MQAPVSGRRLRLFDRVDYSIVRPAAGHVCGNPPGCRKGLQRPAQPLPWPRPTAAQRSSFATRVAAAPQRLWS